MFDVSIIIINYNTLKMTDECICSVIEKTSGISYEIILVDNASIDGSKEFFSKDKRVTYIYNDENLGFSRANNKGIERAQGRNILFLNSDTLLRNNAIKILSDFLDKNPKVGACGGNLFDSKGNPVHSFFRYNTSIYEELNKILQDIPDRLLFGKNRQFNYSGHNLKVKHITGADLMTRKTILNTVGVFNPSFFMYHEDTELCHRMSKAGYYIVSVPAAEITHLVHATVKDAMDDYYKQRIQEDSRNIYFNLTHSRLYHNIADKFRFLYFRLKTMSPRKQTRIRAARQLFFLNSYYSKNT